MKFVLISDTHCGARNNSDIWIEYQRQFYEDVLFPYMLENDIKTIIHLGDYYEHRKYINFKSLNANRKHFLNHLREYGIIMHIICGNHDVFYKSTNELCSLKELLGYYTDCVKIYMEPTVVDYDGCNIALVPWINNENYAETVHFLNNCDASLLGGHLELNGFEVLKGVKSTHGMDMKLFKRFEQVWSGHFHTKSSNGNIQYLGSQLEFTWADCNDAKYFHVFDTETRELTAIKNPITMFEKVLYDDTKVDYTEYDVSGLSKKFVKVVVVNKQNPYDFDLFLDRIQKQNPHELKIAETFNEFLGDNVNSSEITIEDTATLLDDYVEAVTTNMDKDRMKQLMREIYVEASNMEIA